MAEHVTLHTAIFENWVVGYNQSATMALRVELDL